MMQVTALLLGLFALGAAAQESSKPAGTLCVMTYNLRFASATPPNAWPQRRPLMQNPRIDWILTRGPVTVDAEEIVTFSRDGKFPSDHCPLVAWLRFGD